MNLWRTLIHYLRGELLIGNESDRDRLHELQHRTIRAEEQATALRDAREHGLTRQEALKQIWGRPPEWARGDLD